jgi:hypothetical protein
MKGTARIEVFYKPELHKKMEKVKQRIIDDVIGAGAIPEVFLTFDTNPSGRYMPRVGYNNLENDSGSIAIRFSFIEPDLKKLTDFEWAEAVGALGKAEDKSFDVLKSILKTIK